MKSFLLLLLVAITAESQAHELTLSGGISQYTKSSDGFWYQEAFPYTIHNTTPAVSVKYLTGSNHDNWQFGVSYNFLGHITSSALATASDANYNTDTKGCNGQCWPLSHWYGSGSVQNISILTHWNHSSGLYLEGGLSITRAKWDVVVPDWRQCETCAPQPISVTEPKVYSYDPTVAVGYRKGLWSLQLNVSATHNKGDQYQMIYKAYSPTLLLGYTIHF